VPAVVDPAHSRADAYQGVADADQQTSDDDRAASSADQAASDADQETSDTEQAAADRSEVGDTDPESRALTDESRGDRARVSAERQATNVTRRRTSLKRARTSRDRVAIAIRPDVHATERDARASWLEEALARFDPSAAHELAAMRLQEAAERQDVARERARLEAELIAAYRDDLTGALRREMGRLALANEIARARRGDGRFVVAFVDVDDLKGINDRQGHAAGDEALVSVVVAMRDHLRSFDPIARYGGDEFVAGVGGTPLADVERRFALIASELREAGIGISVGLAELEDDETADELMARADQALYERRRAVRA
jgi:diguanylate cyclase (GGDEF)-like protein